MAAKVLWYDPDRDVDVEAETKSERRAVQVAVTRALGLRSGRGHPAIEFIQDDESSLTVATDGTRAYLVWTNTLGETLHSVGADLPGATLTFDYFGSWSEAPSNRLVALSDAIESAETFLRDGIPDTAMVIFSPD